MKTKVLITATAQLMCAFVFAYAKSRFSNDVAQIEVFLCLFTAGRTRNNCNFLNTPQHLHVYQNYCQKEPLGLCFWTAMCRHYMNMKQD